MIVLNANEYPQGSEPWLRARIGAATASRFIDATRKVNRLDEKQAAYVAAMRGGATPALAAAAAGYKQKPTAAAIDDVLRGGPTWHWGYEAEAYASLLALETIAREPLDDTYVTYAMQRGRELEPYAREAYQIRTGAVVEEVSLILTDDERFGYSADGMVDDDGLIEIKAPAAPPKIVNTWMAPAEAHHEYLLQMQGGMWITGRKWCDLVVYCPWLKPVGKDLFVKRIHRDEALIEKLESDLVEFMGLVDTKLAALRRPTKMSGAAKDEAEAPPWQEPAAPAITQAAERAATAAGDLIADPFGG